MLIIKKIKQNKKISENQYVAKSIASVGKYRNLKGKVMS